MFIRKLFYRFFFNMTIWAAILAIVMIFLSALSPKIPVQYGMGLVMYAYISMTLTGLIRFGFWKNSTKTLDKIEDIC